MELYKVSCFSPNGDCYAVYNGCTLEKVQELKKKFEPIGDTVEYKRTH